MCRSKIPWGSPPGELTLKHEEIHVWYASINQTSAAIKKCEQVLSKQETERANRFLFERHRRRQMATQGILRYILSRYVHKEPEKLEFEYGSYRKPYLANQPHGHKLYFNVSHSGDLALFALGLNREVGVDIERVSVEKPVDEIAERFFSAREVAEFKSLPMAQRTDAFFDYWTLKEAYLKARGYGLSKGLAWFAINFSSANGPAVINHDEPVDAPNEWSLHRLDGPDPAYKAALAVQGRAVQLACWRWEPDQFLNKA